jgi:hypothetical protein
MSQPVGERQERGIIVRRCDDELTMATRASDVVNAKSTDAPERAPS